MVVRQNNQHWGRNASSRLHGIWQLRPFKKMPHVTDLIGEVSSAGFELNRGVQKVNNAIRQIDQHTTQTAALVEEIATGRRI
jgi:hypothetical protein